MSSQLPDLPGLFAAVDSARTVMALSSRDWGTERDIAWLWGVFLGWGPNDDPDGTEDAGPEMAVRHGWDPATLERLRTLHAAVKTLTIDSIGDLLAEVDRVEKLRKLYVSLADGPPVNGDWLLHELGKVIKPASSGDPRE